MPTRSPSAPPSPDEVRTASESTATDREPDRARTVAILTRVLDYGDLAGRTAGVLAVLDGSVARVRVDRGDRAGMHGDRLLLPDAYVSRKHALLRWSALGWTIENLSAHGTLLGDKALGVGDRLHLRDGDLLEMGHSLVAFREVEVTAALRPLLEGGPVDFGPTATMCPALVALKHDLDKVAATDLPILFLGETGTGKEVLTSYIHERSGRPSIVAVNCANLDAQLAESRLFGHRRGAFTGAEKDHVGLFERAGAGTLFLDEVGLLPIELQGKLLRAVEEKKVTPLGAAGPVDAAPRLVAATNATLHGVPEAFREDLLARLGGFLATLPPLRERREDLGLLVAHFLGPGREVAIDPAAARVLFFGPLRGNIRVLRRAITTAALLSAPGRIEIGHLARVLPDLAPGPAPIRAEEGRDAGGEGPRSSARSGCPPREELAGLLTRLGSIRAVAVERGVAERTVDRWMRQLGLSAPHRKR